MPVLLSFEQKAYDLNERILELLVSDTISELQAFLLFIDPGTSSDGSATPSQGWHRVFPPLPVTPAILSALRERGPHLYARRTPGGIGEVLSRVEALEAAQNFNERVLALLDSNIITELEASKLRENYKSEAPENQHQI